MLAAETQREHAEDALFGDEGNRGERRRRFERHVHARVTRRAFGRGPDEDRGSFPNDFGLRHISVERNRAVALGHPCELEAPHEIKR